MDKSREQFEAWFPKMVNGLPDGMIQAFDEMLFTAWQASRAAIEIELPTNDMLSSYVCGCCADHALEMAEQYLRAQGLRMKGE